MPVYQLPVKVPKECWPKNSFTSHGSGESRAETGTSRALLNLSKIAQVSHRGRRLRPLCIAVVGIGAMHVLHLAITGRTVHPNAIPPTPTRKRQNPKVHAAAPTCDLILLRVLVKQRMH